MEEDSLIKLENFANEKIKQYFQESQSAYKANQEDKALNREISKEERSNARKIVREIKRAKATGRISKFLRDELEKQEAKKTVESHTPNNPIYADTNNNASQSQYQQAFQSTPFEITPSTPSSNSKFNPSEINEIASVRHPWQMVLRKEGGVTQYKIESESRLYNGLDSWASASVSGLGTWKSVSEGYVVLKGNVSEGVCQDASIEVEGSLPTRIEFSEDSQTKFAAQLGYIYQEENVWKVRQNAFHNFTVTDTCVGGKLAIYPIPT